MVTSDVCSPVTPVYPRIFPRILTLPDSWRYPHYLRYILWLKMCSYNVAQFEQPFSIIVPLSQPMRAHLFIIV